MSLLYTFLFPFRVLGPDNPCQSRPTLLHQILLPNSGSRCAIRAFFFFGTAGFVYFLASALPPFIAAYTHAGFHLRIRFPPSVDAIGFFPLCLRGLPRQTSVLLTPNNPPPLIFFHPPVGDRLFFSFKSLLFVEFFRSS